MIKPESIWERREVVAAQIPSLQTDGMIAGKADSSVVVHITPNDYPVIRSFQVHPSQVGSVNCNILEIRAFQVRLVKTCVDKGGPAQVGSGQIGVKKNRVI